jgi:FkbM family methyltransferase
MNEHIRSFPRAAVDEILSRRLAAILYDRLSVHQMTRALKRIRASGFVPDYVVDVGAYRGSWTREAMRVFPKSRFLMIEPLQQCEIELNKLAAIAGVNIEYERALVADACRDVRFFEMASGSSIYSERTSVARKTVTLRAVRLDAVLEDRSFRGTGLAKLDVQGAELDVLSGLDKKIEEMQVIIMEMPLRRYNDGAPEFVDIIEFMNSRDFVLSDICSLLRRRDHLVQIDGVFLRRSLAESVETWR